MRCRTLSPSWSRGITGLSSLAPALGAHALSSASLLAPAAGGMGEGDPPPDAARTPWGTSPQAPAHSGPGVLALRHGGWRSALAWAWAW